MKIKLKTSADVVGIGIRSNNEQDGREAAVDLEIGVTDKEAEKMGEDFAHLAFSSMQVLEEANDAGRKIIHLQDSIKPGKRVVYEKHKIELEEQVFESQPRLLGIKTVDGEARVIAKVRVPIDVGRTKLIAALGQKVGQTVKVNFEVVQESFEFQTKKRREKDAKNLADNDAAQAEATH